MTKVELGRGERVLPGLYRLRLPLPWPGVPHANAWAIRAGDGIVLVDCGLDREGAFEQLEFALTQVGLGLDQVRELVITHAHTDHWGQAATVVQRTGARVWMHPANEHGRVSLADPAANRAHYYEIGRQSGVPERVLQAEIERRAELPSGLSGLVDADVELRTGTTVDTDLGPLVACETPGHAPSHVCLYNADHRLLISGDHLLGRVSVYFDYGWTPDPVGEFLDGLDRIDALDVRLCVAGHGRPFGDVAAHIQGHRDLVAERLRATRAGLADMPLTGLELAPAIFGEPLTPLTASWRLGETLAYLDHLAARGEVARESDGDAERWRAV